MGKINRKTAILTCLILLTLLWMGVIFWFSAQVADKSSSMSGSLLNSLLAAIIPHWEKRTAAEQQSIFDGLHTIFRKCGHLSEYAILGGLLAATARQFRINISKSRQAVTKEVIILPAFCALLYACSDELHQHFVPGRSCELRDICIDFVGALLGILLLTAAALLRRRKTVLNAAKNSNKKPRNS